MPITLDDVYEIVEDLFYSFLYNFVTDDEELLASLNELKNPIDNFKENENENLH